MFLNIRFLIMEMSGDFEFVSQRLAYEGADLEWLRNFIKNKAIEEQGYSGADKYIKNLVSIPVLRHNNLERILKRSTPNGAANIRRLVELFNIKQKPEDSRTVTLSRIMKCFPIEATSIAAANNISMATIRVDKNLFPPAMRTGCFSALIPAHMPYTDVIMKSYTYFYALHCLGLKRINLSPLTRPILNDQMLATEMAMEKSFIPHYQRVECIQNYSYNIMIDGKLNPYLIELAERYDKICSC